MCQSTKVLDLVHTDVCGPVETLFLRGAQFFLLIKDGFSYLRHVYFYETKIGSKRVPKKLNTKCREKETGNNLKVIRTDNELEFINSELKRMLDDHGIRHERTKNEVVYTPQQNDCTERKNRNLVEAAKTMIQ